MKMTVGITLTVTMWTTFGIIIQATLRVIIIMAISPAKRNNNSECDNNRIKFDCRGQFLSQQW